MLGAALVCCTLWGSAIPAIKVAYGLFRIGEDDTASRIVLAGFRFTLAGIMTVAFGSMIERRFLVPKGSSLIPIGVLGLFQTIGQYFFFFIAVANITGVRGSIINASGNFLAIIFSVFLFRMEKPELKKFIGCVVGFAGILMILGGPAALLSGGALTLKGEGAMLAADAFYALSVCCMRIYAKSEDPVILSGYQFVFGGIVLALIGFLMGGHLVFYTPSCVWLLIYMGFISAGAYTLWGILLKYNPVSRVAILGFINPVMSVLLAALILGENREAFSVRGLAALVLVSLGIIIVNHGGKQAAPAGKD